MSRLTLELDRQDVDTLFAAIVGGIPLLREIASDEELLVLLTERLETTAVEAVAEGMNRLAATGADEEDNTPWRQRTLALTERLGTWLETQRTP
ncbi:MAG: hypothetical protein L0Z49_04845 [Actinobacteria bacterium]|nr:hypothetical protein [Actinomycetota bacterium]